MNVSCARCQTEYSFERARVQAPGIGVKCTNCGHLFTVEPAGTTRPGMPDAGGSVPASEARGWLIRRGDGSTYSCESLKELQAWILEGRVVPEDQLSRTGDAWRPLSSMQELSTFFQVQAPASAAPPRPLERSAQRVAADGEVWSGVQSAGASGEYSLGSQQERQDSGAWTADWLEGEGESDGPRVSPASSADSLRPTEEPAARPQAARMPSDAFGAIDDFGEWEEDLSFGRRSLPPLAALLGLLTLGAVLALLRPWEGGPAPSAVPMQSQDSEVKASPSPQPSDKASESPAAKAPPSKLGPAPTKPVEKPPAEQVAAKPQDKPSAPVATAPPAKQVTPRAAPPAEAAAELKAPTPARPKEDSKQSPQGAGKPAAKAVNRAKEKAPIVKAPPAKKAPAAKPAPRRKDYDGLMRAAKRDLLRGRARAALGLYEEAAGLKEASPEPLSGMGWAYINLNQPHIAVIKFRQAMSKSARYGDAYIGMGRACRMMGQNDQAIRYYEKYLDIHPRGPSASIARNALELLRQ